MEAKKTTAGETATAGAGASLTIHNEADFEAARVAGLLEYVGSGSEQGYYARSYYPRGFVYRGFVRRGHRAGLYKITLTGKGGPYGNSSTYCTNNYYRVATGEGVCHA